MSKKRKNITVAVTPEHYREIRHLAVEYDTTVTTLVAYLLKRLPDALRRANYPKPEPKSATAPTNPGPSLKRSEFCPCEPVKPSITQTDSEASSRNPNSDTEPVSQYTVSTLQKSNSLDANP